MATFILTPGGWQGGWAYEAVERLLVARGHTVEALTLAGLDAVPAPGANLSTHIEQVAQAVRRASGDIVLVGYSYGGMVITGAADLTADRIKALVYVDAYVPESGDSAWSLTSQYFRDVFIAGASVDGLSCVPPDASDPRRRPHPMAAFLQAITLSGQWRHVPRKTFIGAHGWEGSPFRDLYDRLSADPDWTTVALQCGHNIPRHEPEALARILTMQAVL